MPSFYRRLNVVRADTVGAGMCRLEHSGLQKCNKVGASESTTVTSLLRQKLISLYGGGGGKLNVILLIINYK